MSTKRILICIMSFLVLISIFAFIAPFGMGKMVEHTLTNQLNLFNRTFPLLQITVKEYHRGLYQSDVLLEITQKTILSEQEEAKPYFQTQLKTRIKHGPIIWGGNKPVNFAVAELTSQIALEDNANIQFDQKFISVISHIPYTGNFHTLFALEKISGRFEIPNSKSEDPTRGLFSFNNITLDLSIKHNHIQPTYHFTAKEVLVDADKDFRVKIGGLKLFTKQIEPNHSKIAALPDTEQQIFLDSLEVKYRNGVTSSGSKVLQLIGLEGESKLTSKSDKHNFSSEMQFKEITIDELKLGASKFKFSVNKIPKEIFTQILELGNTVASHDENPVMTIFREAQWDTEIKLEDQLGLPGGDFLLNGRAQVISKLQNGKMNYEDSNGGLSITLSKEALLYVIKMYANNQKLSSQETEKVINSTLSMINASPYIIDTGAEYEFYLSYNKDLYFNGVLPQDELSVLQKFSLKRPFSANDELLVSIWSSDADKIKEILNRDKNGIDTAFVFREMRSPLQAAAHIGNRDIVQLLLQHKYAVDHADSRNQTALYWAARNGHLDLLEDLLKKGASPNTKNLDGWTPLQEASEKGHIEIVSVLLSHKAKINEKDNEGRTALYWATNNNQKEVVQLLLKKGADPKIASVKGLTPLDVAKRGKHQDLIDIFENANNKKVLSINNY